MRSRKEAPPTIWTALVLSACGAAEPAPQDRAEASNGGTAVQSTEAALPGPWREVRLPDLDLDLDRFRAIRARYVQVMYDLEGREEVQYTGLVHIDLDRTIHSGPWDGSVPAVIEPLRDPGLRVVWQVQNALYSGFDRVLTDSHLSVLQRVMPAGTIGLLAASVTDSLHTQVNTSAGPDQDVIPVARTQIPDGALNVLTLPYALAAMDLVPGDRYVLPGYAMINGPDGGGIHWRGAVHVVSQQDRSVKGRRIPVFEVMHARMDERNGLTPEQIDFSEVGRRVTRLLISPEPPYLLGRANLMMTEDGTYALVREFLGLVDWADQPLPVSEVTDSTLWDLDLEAGRMSLKEAARPRTLLELRPES